MMRFVRTLGLAFAVSAAMFATGCAGDLGQDQANQVETKRIASFEIFEGQDGQFYFRLRAANGELQFHIRADVPRAAI